MTEVEESSPDTAFVAMMSSAAEQAATDAPEAPYGYTRDRETGEMRPKKSPGRGGARKSPSIEDLKTPKPASVEDGEGDGGAAAPDSAAPPADRAPDERKLSRKGKAARPDAPVPQFRAGVIAKGMNKLYAKAGKIVRVMDPEAGQAIIDVTRKESDDDVTVGEAWEELAKTNPRIRKFLLKMIAGGAWAQLFAAHLPILAAVIMKPAILKRIPFAGLIESLAEPDDDTPAGEGGLPGGMTAADAGQMADLARRQMEAMGLQLPPEVAGQMEQMAAAMLNGGDPPKTVRNQPRRDPSRAKRHGG